MPSWSDIETAPKNRKVEIWTKIWLADGDRFEGGVLPRLSMGRRR